MKLTQEHIQTCRPELLQELRQMCVCERQLVAEVRQANEQLRSVLKRLKEYRTMMRLWLKRNSVTRRVPWSTVFNGHVCEVRLVSVLVLAFWLGGCASPQTPNPIPQTPKLPFFESAAMAPLPVLIAHEAQATAPIQWLMWDGTPPFEVRTGPARGQYTNTINVTSNAVVYTPGLAYEVSNVAGLAYWPSNRIEQWVLEVTDNLTGWRDELVWRVYTNSPVENRMFLRLRQELKGYQ
jgi:hypothetical protein